MRAIILLAIIYLVNGQRDHGHSHDIDFHRNCPPNQHWLKCGPPCGDRTCPRPFNDQAFKCNPMIKCGKEGCYCQPGYARDSRGACIPEKQCPPHCRDDKHEVLNNCGNRCEPKCPRSIEEASRQPACPFVCGPPACACKKGFYRSPTGSCVLLEQCPDICSANEYYNSCGRLCEDTCRLFLSGEPNRCPAMCDRKGACHCKQGFYRNSEGKCVPPSHCEQCRGRNEQLVKCPLPIECRPSCEKTKTDDRCFHNMNHHDCRPGCVCKKGFVRRWDGACIRSEECRDRSRDHDHRPH